MTAAATGIRKQATTFLENRLTHKGRVLAVRAWTPASFYEIDLHLPEADFHRWQKAQHIKVRVAPFIYRDYTPADWDAGTHTCTLYIDAGHDGAGARWVKELQAGDTIAYLGIGPTPQSPGQEAKATFLGDQSAIGHFLALAQLAGQATHINGAIVLAEPEHRQQYEHDFSRHLNLELLPFRYSMEHSLMRWAFDCPIYEDQVFYLAGNNDLMTGLRKALRQHGINPRQIRAQGFWH